MSDAVGDDNGAADALRGCIAQRLPQRAEQLRALIVRVVARRLDDVDLHIVQFAEPLLDRRPRRVALRLSLAEPIALRAVDDDGDDVFQRPAILALQRRIEQRGEQQRADEGA